MRHGDLHSGEYSCRFYRPYCWRIGLDCAGTVPWEAFAVPTFEVSGHFTEHIEDPSNPFTRV